MSDQLEPTHGHELSTSTEPIGDPGLPEHQYRPQDVDESQAKRTERQISWMFRVAGLLFVGFVVAYLAIDIDAEFLGWSAQNFAFGMTLGGGMLLIGVGIIQWAKKLMGDHEMVEMRHPSASPPEEIGRASCRERV